MLTRAQEQLIRSLHTKKGRQKSGLCLVEGAKTIETAGDAIDFTFTKKDTPRFEKLSTTETPQDISAVARIPAWDKEALCRKPTIIVLDGVQDPGNVGAILRLCLGFESALVLVESADPSSPKVIRSSVGAVFQVPWMQVSRSDAEDVIAQLQRPVFRLEKRAGAKDISAFTTPPTAVLIAGSEGSGISLRTKGVSVVIPHLEDLESLNVGHAVAIGLFLRARNT